MGETHMRGIQLGTMWNLVLSSGGKIFNYHFGLVRRNWDCVSSFFFTNNIFKDSYKGFVLKIMWPHEKRDRWSEWPHIGGSLYYISCLIDTKYYNLLFNSYVSLIIPPIILFIIYVNFLYSILYLYNSILYLLIIWKNMCKCEDGLINNLKKYIYIYTVKINLRKDGIIQ